MRLFPLLIALLLAACGGSPEVDALLAVADSLSGVKPDSALRLLQQQEAGVPHWSKGQRMRHALLTAKAMNKAYVPLTADSLMTVVADYYDRHGTANEQMEAHYLLGCVYRDLGEAPRAIEAYQDAVARADTTAQDCDYALLCRVLSQEANVFYQENLMSEYLKCLDKSIVYATYAHDTLAAINSFIYKMSAYDRLGLPDKVTTICEQTTNQLSLMGYRKLAAQFSVLGISAFLKQKQIERAKCFIDLYENLSGYFDKFHNIEAGRESFYNLKGRYFHAIMQYDSAEYYYRKELQYGMDFMNQNMASKGLALLFNETNCPDSAAKYALYAYSMNDSVYAHMATKEVEHVKGMYNYTQHLQNAQAEKERADRVTRHNLIMLLILILIIMVIIYSFYKVKKKKQIAAKKFKSVLDSLSRVLLDVMLLRSQVDTLEHFIEERDAEKDDLLLQKTTLLHQIKEKENLIMSLRKQVADYQQREKMDQKNTEVLMKESDIYQSLLKISARGTLLNEEMWNDIQKLVLEVLPNFCQFIAQSLHGLNSTQYRICILLRLHISQASIGYMLGVSPPYINKMCRVILKKLFGDDGTGKELEERLFNYH